MKKVFTFASLVFVLALALTQGGCDSFDDSGLNTAMQEYLTAIQDGDVNAFIELLPSEGTFRFASYSETSGNLLAAERYTKNQAIQNITERNGLFYVLFSGDANYRYRDRIASAPLSAWNRSFNIFRFHRGIEKSYVRWTKESDGWKVSEVGDSVP